MDPLPPRARIKSGLRSVIKFITGTVSPPIPQYPPQRQEDPPEQGPPNITSPPKNKGKEICCSSNGKNICVSADGTLGEFGAKNSNVVELQSRIIKDEKQLTYYISGIGTYGGSTIFRVIDSAVATSFERNVLRAYEWLCNHYEPGDRIFLFGFSRGAYQVRVIAGMIERVGLLYKGNNSQLPSVFKLYMNTMEKLSSSPRGQESTELAEAKEQCKTFKDAFSRPSVKVHFVGAWDTVSSIGITRGPCLPETTNGMAHVCHFRQALALDERRVRFWPEYADASSKSDSSQGGDVKEVWFAGSHSDIGGWSVPNKKLDSFGPALRWMTCEAMNNGLRMRQHKKPWEPLNPEPSLKGLWHILEYLPLRCPSYDGGISRQFHKGAPRQIQARQRIHRSVFEAMGIDTDIYRDPEMSPGLLESASNGYKPRARFSDKGHDPWNDIYNIVRERLEDDPFTSVHSAVQMLKHAIGSDDAIFKAAIQVLKNHSSVNQSQATGGPTFSKRQGPEPLAEVSTEASDVLLSALDQEVTRKDRMMSVEIITVLLSALAIVPPNEKAQLDGSMFRNITAALHDHNESRKSYRQVVRRYGHKIPDEVSAGHWRTVEYAAFSNNQDFISTGSYDAVVIWDCNKRTSKSILYFDQDDSVDSVEVSGDGSRCVTGHNDGSVQWWNVEAGHLLLTMKPRGNNDRVSTVTLSSDTSTIASGSWGGIIRLWAVETGEDLHGGMVGHAEVINEVAFSSDGAQLASASDDGTIRLWDTSNGQHLKVLKGHTNAVWSATFSPCATKVISASSDTTVCIWDTVSGELMKKLGGHTQWVYYAIFSPNQNFVVSGSGDGTVRVWDPSSGETLIVYKTRSPVRAVAFSGDGKKIASGCDNGKVHIWDASLLF